MTPGFVPPAGCWASIGVAGDRSCPELPAVVHCRNCPVMMNAARGLFERETPPGYAAAWGAAVAQGAVSPRPSISVVVFRVGREWLAIDTALVAEIAAVRPIHRIPHRAHALLQGIVNIRGQLQLSVSLAGLLGMPAPAAGSGDRFMVIGESGNAYVIVVNQVHGVERVVEGTIGPAPATLPPSLLAMTRGIFPWRDHRVGLLAGADLVKAMKQVVA
ncbi:MAG: chemotaxis protein CheW [Acidobacteriota bacterium]